MPGPVTPTFANPRAAQYARPGAPWHERHLPGLLLQLPERPDLLSCAGRHVGTGELLDAVRSGAGWLQARGVRAGDPVGWQVPNDVAAVVLYLATWWLGAVAVPFHEGLTTQEAQRVADAVDGLAFLVAAPGTPLATRPDATVVEGDLLATLGTGTPVADHAATPADPAVVLTTSGSSGTPKSVVHSQRSLAHKARQLAQLHGTSLADAVLVPAPLAHMAGLLHGVLNPVGTGVKAVLMARWDADEALRLVEEEQVTMLFGPPIFALGIAGAQGFSPESVRSVRIVSSGGTAITESYVRDISARFGATVKRTYGSTEAPVACTTMPGDDPERGWRTDGRPVPGVELEVRDADGRVLPSGEEGEIWLRGPELCDGYLDQDQTDDAFVDGWMRTRDLGVVDEAGFLTVNGRISGFIIRGGMNISPREVESALERHPAISQAAVVGQEDPVYGERVVAFVVASEPIDRATCVAWFAEHGIAKYKVPDRVEHIDAIPVLATYQKPDLDALRGLL